MVYYILNIGLQNFSNQVIASLSCRQCSLKRAVITSLSSTVGCKRAIMEWIVSVSTPVSMDALLFAENKRKNQKFSCLFAFRQPKENLSGCQFKRIPGDRTLVSLHGCLLIPVVFLWELEKQGLVLHPHDVSNCQNKEFCKLKQQKA